MKENISKESGLKRLHPAVTSAATLAAGLMRSIAIKRYVPKSRQRELALLESAPQTHPARCQLFREKGAGNYPTIVLGGFVPDATESVEFQRPLLREHGSIYYLNYPRHGFSPDMLAAQLSDLIDDLKLRGQKPLLMGISFGCGLLTDYLRKASQAIHERIRGLVLISPVICTEDLIRPVGTRREGVRFLENSLKKLIAVDPGCENDLNKQVERSRKCFQALFNSGAENRRLNFRHLAIRSKIMDVINNTPSRGGFERFSAMQAFRFPTLQGSLFAGPVLTLLSENEFDILVPSYHTMELFREREQYARLFPGCLVKTVRSADPADGVPHASLIFHYEAYNSLLESWYSKLLYPRLQLAV